MRSSFTTFCLILGLIGGCGGGGGAADGTSDDQQGDDGGMTGDDGGDDGPNPPGGIEESCDAEYLGTGDGCDCGCGVVDPDCGPTVTIDECGYDNCPTGYAADHSDPTQCIVEEAPEVPAGWTCSPQLFGADGQCTCGCGVNDTEHCPATGLDLSWCAMTTGCTAGQWPDPADPTKCIAAKAGWTCDEEAYYDDECDCGCGIADPSCPTSTKLSQCENDGCPSGQSPNPLNLTQCMSNAPQDHWTCDVDLIGDGDCDCGCGSIDIDCPANPTPASCDENHCGSMMELKPGNVGKCWEVCTGTEPANAGNTTCTGAGTVSIFNSCAHDASQCQDGRTYSIECTGGECTCSINNTCVGHATGNCNFSDCGWSLTVPF